MYCVCMHVYIMRFTYYICLLVSCIYNIALNSYPQFFTALSWWIGETREAIPTTSVWKWNGTEEVKSGMT